MATQAQAETDTATQISTPAAADAPADEGNDVTTTTAPANGDMEDQQPDMAAQIEEALANGEDTESVIARFSEKETNPEPNGADTETTSDDANGTDADDSGDDADESPEGDLDDEAEADGGDDEISEGNNQDDDESEALPERYRWKDDFDKKVSKLRKEGFSWSEAESQAKRLMGIPDTESGKDGDEAGTESEDSDVPSVADLREQRKALKEEKRTALKDYDHDRVAELEEQLDELEETSIPEAEAREREAQESAAKQFDIKWEDSWAQAREVYPDASDTNSSLYATMQDIDERIKETDPELYASAEKPLVIARMAAREEGIAPAPKGGKAKPVNGKKPVTNTKAPEQQKQSATRRSAQVNPIAGGGARRTSSQTATAALVDELKDADVSSMTDEQYDALMAKAGLRPEARY